MTEMIEVSDKDFKAATIKMFQRVIVYTLETHEKIESLNKEIVSSNK